MPKKRHKSNRSRSSSQSGGKGGYAVKNLGGESGWVFVPPRSVSDRLEDLEEVMAMIEGGEIEIAQEELRWLLSGSTEFMEAHALLGELAVELGEDLELARGHFGFAYATGEKALKRSNCQGPLLGKETANAAWFDAARGLAWCFEKQGKSTQADDILAKTRKFDPSDPAGIGAMLDDLRSGGLPVVTLG